MYWIDDDYDCNCVDGARNDDDDDDDGGKGGGGGDGVGDDLEDEDGR